MNVAEAGRISLVSIVPPDAQPPAAALEAIAEADQIVIGPGSLFTSVLAVVAVPGHPQAPPWRSQGPEGLRLQPPRPGPETTGYDVAAHADALAAHGLDVDVVLCDPRGIPPASSAYDGRAGRWPAGRSRP